MNHASNNVIGTPRISFRLRPADIVNPRFLFTISGFTTSHVTEAEDPARVADDSRRAAEVIARIWRSPDMYAAISEAIVAEHGPNGLCNHFERLIASIRVRRISWRDSSGALAPYFTVSCDPPVRDPELWASFRRAITSIRYRSTTFGDGVVENFRDCTYCHGVDHTRGLCPFTTQDGWIGPAPDSALRFFNHNPVEYPEFGPPPAGYRGNGRGGPQSAGGDAFGQGAPGGQRGGGPGGYRGRGRGRGGGPGGSFLPRDSRRM
jgi:hypothetical protein